MTQEEKDLLHRDLCARLPYGVKVRVTPIPELEHLTYDAKLFNINANNIFGVMTDDNVKYIPHNIEEIKPYLFPISSMTEEQHNELFTYFHDVEMKEIKISGDYLKAAYLGENAKRDWLNKKHFDYNYLIPIGLAVDATGLNIY